MTTNMDAVIERIRKVMALTTSPSEGEAAAAMAMAKKLLDEHNLTMFDIESKSASDVQDRMMGAISEHSIKNRPGTDSWMFQLYGRIADEFECRTLISPSAGVIWVIGLEDNVRVVKELVGWVIPQIYRLRVEAWTAYRNKPVPAVDGISDKDGIEMAFSSTRRHDDPYAFAISFYKRISHSIGDIIHDNKTTNANKNVTAMVLASNSTVDKYMKEKYDKKKIHKATKSKGSWAGYIAGKKAAAKVDLNLNAKIGNGSGEWKQMNKGVS